MAKSPLLDILGGITINGTL